MLGADKTHNARCAPWWAEEVTIRNNLSQLCAHPGLGAPHSRAGSSHGNRNAAAEVYQSLSMRVLFEVFRLYGYKTLAFLRKVALNP